MNDRPDPAHQRCDRTSGGNASFKISGSTTQLNSTQMSFDMVGSKAITYNGKKTAMQ